MREGRSGEARSAAERWAGDVLQELSASRGDYAQADLDELIELRPTDDLAALSLTMFDAIVGVLNAPGTKRISASLDIPLHEAGPNAADRALPSSSYHELLGFAVWPKRKRGMAMPGFVIEQSPAREVITHGDTLVRGLGETMVRDHVVHREYVARTHQIEGTSHSLLLTFGARVPKREVSVKLLT